MVVGIFTLHVKVARPRAHAFSTLGPILKKKLFCFTCVYCRLMLLCDIICTGSDPFPSDRVQSHRQ